MRTRRPVPCAEVSAVMTDDYVIYACQIEPSGEAHQCAEISDIALSARNNGYHWLHMCAVHDETRQYLEQSWDLEPIIIDAMLVSQNTSFQEILDVERRRLAEHFLVHTSININEIAARMGYTNPQNFSKAFKL
jgi:hypothetical protein